jgi:hypothetical protein
LVSRFESAAEDGAQVRHGPPPVEQRGVAGVLGAEGLDQGHVAAEIEVPDQRQQVGRPAGDRGDRRDEPVVELHDLLHHRQVARTGVDGREVRRGEVLGEHDRLDGQCPRPVPLGEMDKQLDVEGLVERRHLPDGRGERSRVERLEAGLGVEHRGQRRDEQRPDEVAEQDDDLVRLVAGAVRLGDRAVGLDQDRALDPVTLAERAGHLVPGRDRRRQRAQLGQVRGQVRVGVADHVPAGAVRRRRAGLERGVHPGQDRPALAGLVGRGQRVEGRADVGPAADQAGQADDRDAAVAVRRVALGDRDLGHEVTAGGMVRAAVVAGDDAPGDAGQAAGQPVELRDLGPHEVLAVRVLRPRDHAARLAVHGPHHGQVHRPGQSGHALPRARRRHRLGGHRRAVAGRDVCLRGTALGQGGGRVEHRLVLVGVRQVAHGHQRFFHGPEDARTPRGGVTWRTVQNRILLVIKRRASRACGIRRW